ncbi:hypothetical protein BGZ76_004726, partial [Entomortierella beljakovae]
HLVEDEDVEEYNADDTGYSSSDLYEEDDLSHLTRLGVQNVSRQRETQHLVEDEDVEEYNADDTGYSSSDLYEEDDLSHLTRLGVQGEEAQSESQESSHQVDSTTMTYNFNVKKLKNKKCRPFDARSKKSFQKRFESLGSKWKLSTGTVVEDRLYEVGQEYEFYSPIHSFMVDCNDTEVAKHFTEFEWNEICGEWPVAQLEGNTIDYIESFSDVESIDDLEKLLKQRPKDAEEQLVFRCLEDWLHIYSDDPSPFLVAERLSESYWQQEVWGVTRKLAKGLLNCKMLPGEKAGVESKERQNRIMASKGLSNTRACYGKKGDLFCRSFDEPLRDWAVIEAAKVWNIYSSKYTIESTTKLPRPVVQSLNLCWGREGVNVTRFRRGLAARMESTIDKLGMSLSAIYVLMMFRKPFV